MIKSWQLHGRIAVSLAGPYGWQMVHVQVASYFMLAVAVMAIPQLSAADGMNPAVALVAVSSAHLHNAGKAHAASTQQHQRLCPVPTSRGHQSAGRTPS